jgi:hypothetical protein
MSPRSSWTADWLIRIFLIVQFSLNKVMLEGFVVNQMLVIITHPYIVNNAVKAFFFW